MPWYSSEIYSHARASESESLKPELPIDSSTVSTPKIKLIHAILPLRDQRFFSMLPFECSNTDDLRDSWPSQVGNSDLYTPLREKKLPVGV